MFDILVYLYETYYRPDACPEPAALAKKLSAVGFDDVEISEALVWLNDLAAMAGVEQSLTAASTGTRFYVRQELDVLGTPAVGFIQFLESAGLLPDIDRWMLRASFLGRPALDPDATSEWEDTLAQVVVRRGEQAMPVGEPLPVTLPDDARRVR